MKPESRALIALFIFTILYLGWQMARYEPKLLEVQHYYKGKLVAVEDRK